MTPERARKIGAGLPTCASCFSSFSFLPWPFVVADCPLPSQMAVHHSVPAWNWETIDVTSTGMPTIYCHRGHFYRRLIRVREKVNYTQSRASSSRSAELSSDASRTDLSKPGFRTAGQNSTSVFTGLDEPGF